MADDPLTLSVPEAGKRYLNLSRNSSYAAAGRGDLPTIRVGRILRVPVRAMERLLDGASTKPPDSGLLEPAGCLNPMADPIAVLERSRAQGQRSALRSSSSTSSSSTTRP